MEDRLEMKKEEEGLGQGEEEAHLGGAREEGKGRGGVIGWEDNLGGGLEEGLGLVVRGSSGAVDVGQR